MSRISMKDAKRPVIEQYCVRCVAEENVLFFLSSEFQSREYHFTSRVF